MNEDWKGEHLIRVRPDAAARKSELSRLGNVIGKLKGYQTPLKYRVAHGKLVGACMAKTGGRRNG